MAAKTWSLDPRYFQVFFQAFFLAYGIGVLNWLADWQHYLVSVGGCLVFQYVADSLKARQWQTLAAFHKWGFSVLISAMSLCLLLKTQYWHISLVAAFLTVASKYIFRWQGRHVFNPSAFGMIATIVLTGEAWLSPGQWGSDAILFFTVITLGTIVVTRVQKLDVSLAFLFAFLGCVFWRQVMVLGWPADHFVHTVSTGSLLLFTFFMISDPRTTPNHPVARIIWAVLIAVASFYLSAFQWKHNTPVWVLVAAGPLVPLLDRIFRAKVFNWAPTHIPIPFLFIPKFFQQSKS